MPRAAETRARAPLPAAPAGPLARSPRAGRVRPVGVATRLDRLGAPVRG